jgi:hypothetical protein
VQSSRVYTTEAAALAQGSRAIEDLINVAEQKTIALGGLSSQAKQYLEDKRRNEATWEREIAAPLVNKRRQVDSGHSSVAEMQIAYVQANPS